MENVYLTDVRFYPEHGYISFVMKIIEDGKFVSLPATFRFTTENALTRGLSKSNFTTTVNCYGYFCNKVLSRLNDITYLVQEFRLGDGVYFLDVITNKAIPMSRSLRKHRSPQAQLLYRDFLIKTYGDVCDKPIEDTFATHLRDQYFLSRQNISDAFDGI